MKIWTAHGYGVFCDSNYMAIAMTPNAAITIAFACNAQEEKERQNVITRRERARVGDASNWAQEKQTSE